MRTELTALAAALAVVAASGAAVAQQPASGIPTAQTGDSAVNQRRGVPAGETTTDEMREDEEADATTSSQETLAEGGTGRIRPPVESAVPAPQPGQRVGEGGDVFLGQNPVATDSDD